MTHAPFIPAWLDDAGLTPIQFRVLAHLYRRANGKDRCWPGADSIAKACRISDDALWPAIKALEDGGFLRREKRPNSNGNLYVMLPPTITHKNRVTPSPTETGEPSPAVCLQPSPTEGGRQSPGNCGREGYEMKVHHEGEGMKGGDTPVTFPWASVDELPADLRQDLAEAFPSEAGQAKAFSRIRGRKLDHGRPDVHILADWPDVFAAGIAREQDRKPKERRAGFAS